MSVAARTARRNNVFFIVVWIARKRLPDSRPGWNDILNERREGRMNGGISR